MSKIKKNQGLLNVRNVDHKTTLTLNIALAAERKLHKKENVLIADKLLKKTQSIARNVGKKWNNRGDIL